jgi:hypothetical protein
VLRHFLSNVIENPSLRDESTTAQNNFLRNFSLLASLLEEVLVGTNADLNILLLQGINRMASKNSGAVRATMKQLQLFELRDNLLIQTLRCHIASGDTLIKILDGISFEALSNHAKFREQQAAACLLKILIDHGKHLQLQILTIKILKYDIAAS